MKKTIILFTLIFLSVTLFAQNNDIIKVDHGTDLTKAIDKRQYLFPEFTDGSVFMKGNTTSNAKLNYNLLLKEMQFMQGDKILSITDQSAVLLVTINEHTLINTKNGFAEIIARNGGVQLAVEKSITVKEPPKQGAYGTRSETAAIDKYNSIPSSGGVMINLPVEVELKNEVTYYLIKENKQQIANKKGFTKTFSAHKKEIEQYISDNKIDFLNEEQLKQLLTYCAGLQ